MKLILKPKDGAKIYLDRKKNEIIINFSSTDRSNVEDGDLVYVVISKTKRTNRGYTSDSGTLKISRYKTLCLKRD